MIRILFAALAVALAGTAALAQPCGIPLTLQLFPGITSSQVALDFDPTDPTRLIALDINGTVRAINTNTNAITTVLTLTGSAGVNGGYGLAVDPQYASTGAVYIFFPTDSFSSVLRYTRSVTNPAILDPASRTVILQIPNSHNQHTGGWINFGPDGDLYIALGDHGDSANSQNNATLAGKVLRIDIRSDGFPADPNKNYAIPPSNPYVGTSSRPEIICSGLRNPFRCSFDPPTGALFIADVGASTREEVNRIYPADALGQNFGWPCREGLTAIPVGTVSTCVLNPPPFTDPIFDFDHARLVCITGGLIYRGTAIPRLFGRYLVASCGGTDFFSFDPSNPRDSLRSHSGGRTAYCFVANAEGEVFVGLQSGVARLLPGAPPFNDCNHNGISDLCELTTGLDTDFNGNAILDSCERTCAADFYVSGTLNVSDISAFVNEWFANHLAADFNHSGTLSVQDIFDFLSAWFAGC